MLGFKGEQRGGRIPGGCSSLANVEGPTKTRVSADLEEGVDAGWRRLQTTLHIDKARNMEDGTSHHRGIGKTQQHAPQEQENIVTCKQPKGM